MPLTTPTRTTPTAGTGDGEVAGAGGVPGRVAATLLAGGIACGVLAGATGCRDTDFLKEIIYHPYATVEDPDNTVTLNDPDAEAEAPSLSAFDLSEDAPKADTVETVAVPSSQPNTAVEVRSSVFDLTARLPGIEALEGVRLVASTRADAVDHEVEDAEKTEEELSKSSGEDATNDKRSKGSEGKGKKGSDNEDGPDEDKSGETTEGSGTTSGGEGAGLNGSGEAGDGGEGEIGTGHSARETGGYGGDELVYDPGNQLKDPQAAEHVAAVGQAAVVVQAIGGEGALVAMDAWTYKGTHSTCAKSFKEVFGNELAAGFAKSALLWRRDGSAPGYLTDASNNDNTQALVDAIKGGDGSAGSILYPGDTGSQKDYFSSKQLKAFKTAGIQLVPLDLSSATGIQDAVTAVGKILASSDACAQDAQANAEAYCSLFDDVFSAAAATHGDALATDSEYGSTKVLGSYTSNPVSGRRRYDVYACVCTGFEQGVQLKGSSVDPSGGLLFADEGCGSSPLSVLMQAGGVVNRPGAATTAASDDTLCVWGRTDGPTSASALSGGGDALARCSRVSCAVLQGRSMSDGELMESRWLYGLGSSQVPYLIVCATEDMSAAEVKAAVVACSKDPSSPYYSQWTAAEVNGDGLTTTCRSVVGTDYDFASTHHENLFVSGLSFSSTVRENPCGLIGSWTDGSLEAVLESVWVADLYSKAPSGSTYEPVNDMSNFSVTVGGSECTSVKQAVRAFYKAVYRYDLASADYGEVVTDEGGDLS